MTLAVGGTLNPNQPTKHYNAYGIFTALNLMSQFNLENVTTYNKEPETEKVKIKIKVILSLRTTLHRGYKTFFMLSSAETKIYPAHKC